MLRKRQFEQGSSRSHWWWLVAVYLTGTPGGTPGPGIPGFRRTLDVPGSSVSPFVSADGTQHRKSRPSSSFWAGAAAARRRARRRRRRKGSRGAIRPPWHPAWLRTGAPGPRGSFLRASSSSSCRESGGPVVDLYGGDPPPARRRVGCSDWNGLAVHERGAGHGT